MIIYNNIMFSKRNSNILKNDPNSMFDIGKKLSSTSIRNISIDNPSENPDMQLALNKLNALPTIAPTTLNKFPITKSNNIQKNVDIDEFVLSINEADKTLQTISIIVNNVDSQQILTGGAENDDINYNNLFNEDENVWFDNEIPWNDSENDINEELEQQIKFEKEAILDQVDTDLKNMKRLDYIYLRNDPDIILENMRIYKYSNNYHEKNDARDYLLGIYKDANTFTIDQKIPDDIEFLKNLWKTIDKDYIMI